MFTVQIIILLKITIFLVLFVFSHTCKFIDLLIAKLDVDKDMLLMNNILPSQKDVA